MPGATLKVALGFELESTKVAVVRFSALYKFQTPEDEVVQLIVPVVEGDVVCFLQLIKSIPARHRHRHKNFFMERSARICWIGSNHSVVW